MVESQFDFPTKSLETIWQGEFKPLITLFICLIAISLTIEPIMVQLVNQTAIYLGPNWPSCPH